MTGSTRSCGTTAIMRAGGGDRVDSGQGDDWDDLKDMVRDAVLCHFDDRETPRVIRLHFVREEAIAV